EIHDSLARFGQGLEKMDAFLKLQRLKAMREGFQGLKGALSSGAEQVQRLADYTYPVLTFQGIRPEVNHRQFWPEGRRIAEGLQQAADGVDAAKKELDDLATDLPALRASLMESVQVVNKTREALALALKQQDKVEPLLKDVPEHAARLIEELPKLGGDLARI